METATAILSSITTIIVGAMSAYALIKSRHNEAKEKAKTQIDSVRQKLALQVIGYHCEEEFLAQELSTHTKETAKQIKERMRGMAKTHSENKEQTYPKMTAKEAREYIK